MGSHSDLSPEQLLDAYLAGTLDAETAERVRRYWEATPARRGYLAGLRATLAGEGTMPDLSASRERMLAKLAAEPVFEPVIASSRLAASRSAPTPVGRRGTQPIASAPPWWTRAAWSRTLSLVAVCAALVAVVWGWSRHHAESPWHDGQRYATTAGQRARVILPDSSLVILAPRTTLVLDAAFGKTSRAVRLSGHAYFDVRHVTSTETPFVVWTGSVSTRVLGTAFDIERYPGASTTHVAVLEGRVSAGGHRRATVSQGMMCSFGDSTTIVRRIPDPDSYATWTTGQLRFDRTPVNDVLARLGEWYGIRFVLPDSQASHQHITAVFDGTSQRGMMEAIALILNVTPTEVTDSTGTTIMLQPRPRTVSPAPRRRHGGDSLLISHMELGR
jgi:ferric-dicitrate binding protein FerR (iron transport regulator)